MISPHGGNIIKICSTYGLRPEDILDFSANINPLGFPEVIVGVINSNLQAILHYPDPDCIELKKALTKRHPFGEANIIIGNGSTELFYLIPRAFGVKKGFIFQPTFTEFARALRSSGVTVDEIICDEDDMSNLHLIEYAKLFAAAASLKGPRNRHNKFGSIIFLCNPNNPTGLLIKKWEILELANQLRDTLIVVDEAFMDFVPTFEDYSVMTYAPEMENLIMVRSLTKFFGMPGIRLGFLVAHKDLVNMMVEYKEPWTVNSLAQMAGKAAISDESFILKSREYTNKERLFLYEQVSKIKGLLPFEPSANFILVKIIEEGLDASILCERLIKYGIAIRDCSNFIGLSERYFRTAVRKREENIRLLEALVSVIK